jgi:hypothetical protein
MKQGWGILALTLAGAAHAAEPAEPLASATPVPRAAEKASETPAPRKPLDLRIGNIRNYMMPKEYLAAIGQPDADKNTVVVEGKRELLPMKFEQPIPAGFPPATLWWALRNPSQSWRIILPDVNAPPAGPPSVVPPPVFRWGP